MAQVLPRYRKVSEFVLSAPTFVYFHGMFMQRAFFMMGLLAVGCGETQPGTPTNTTSSSSSGSSGAGGASGSGGGGQAGGGGGGQGGGGMASCSDGIETTEVDPASTPELAIIGDPGSPLGIFDPSVVYPAGAPGGALSYSTVLTQEAVHTRIALSADAGATWTFVADANAVEPAMIETTDTKVCPGGSCTGNLINEVSSLIIDPDDPDPARRWKLFTHRYLVTPGATLLHRYGYIALYTAAEPQGPWSGPENVIGWDSETAFSSAGAATNASKIPALANCFALTEPGALWVPGLGIDLALGCASVVGGVSIRIERLRSTDHGKTFTYVGKLLGGEDAACLDAVEPRVNAGDLFFAGGKQYLIATPSTSDKGYRGCFVFPIDDPVSGLVRRDAQGQPVIVRRIDNPDKRFTGACSYAEGVTGYLVPIAFLDQPPKVFRTFRTNIVAP